MKLWANFNSNSNFALIWYRTCGSRHTQRRQTVSCVLRFHMAQPRLPFFHLVFPSFCHSSLYFVLPVRAPAPSHVFLCTLQVCLWPGQTKMTIVNGLLLGWMAALICSMQATGWQQHMCWWQPHTGQTLAPYNTSHCTPVPRLEGYKVWNNPQQNCDALLACVRFNLWCF